MLGDRARSIQFSSGVIGANKEAFFQLPSFVANVDIDGFGGTLSGDFADFLLVDGVEADGKVWGEIFSHFFEQKIVGEPEFVAVAVLLLQGLVVGLESEDVAVVFDSDEESAAVSIEEGGDGF